MITSEAGKALIQTCLAKDEPAVESTPTVTTLNNNDVICIDGKKRTNSSTLNSIPSKRVKLNSSDEIKQVKPPTTVAVPLSCLINSNPQQQSINGSTSFTIALDGMNFVLTPPSNTSQPSPSSNIPLVLTLGDYPYQPS
jgi:hypothetical protein